MLRHRESANRQLLRAMRDLGDDTPPRRVAYRVPRVTLPRQVSEAFCAEHVKFAKRVLR